MTSQTVETLNLNLKERYELATDIGRQVRDIKKGRSPGLTEEEFFFSVAEDKDAEN